MADPEPPASSAWSAELGRRLAGIDRGWWATAIGLLVVGLSWAIP